MEEEEKQGAQSQQTNVVSNKFQIESLNLPYTKHIFLHFQILKRNLHHTAYCIHIATDTLELAQIDCNFIYKLDKRHAWDMRSP